ncbi:MAG TPA: hypothetical protein VKP14_00960 [Gaiellaceae bacterium]|nr:hypothetical protein [Gaiellaceae bacterium]
MLGTWEFLGGAVRVTASGAGFAGVVTAKTSEGCSRPVGQHIWTIAARGATYAGTHVTYLRPGCKAKTVAATFAITQKQDTYTLNVCTGNVCTTHKRLKPPA